MKNYLDLVETILIEGVDYGDRTKTGRRSVYGQMMKFDLAEGFPLVTAKSTFFKGVVHELLWFLRGETNIKSLTDNGVNIWNQWADENGELGPVYGKMWRDWPKFSENYNTGEFYEDPHGIDQLKELIANLKADPHSSRHIVSGWNPALLPDPTRTAQDNVAEGKQALPPCHTLWQVFVDGNNRMHMTLYQRSADVFLGVPFNIASYALLLQMIAYHTGKEPGVFTWMGGDCHLYHNHIEQAKVLVGREPLKLPTVEFWYCGSKNIWDVTPAEIKLHGYESHPAIKGAVAV